MRSKTQGGTLATLLGALCWGLSGVLGERLFSLYALPSAWLTALRMLSAGLILSLLALLRDRAGVLSVLRRPQSLLRLALFSLGGLLLSQLSYLSAIQHSNAGTATVLQNLSIVLVAVYTCVREKKRPGAALTLSVLLSLLGVALIATGGKLGSLQFSAAGLLWGVASAVGGASYSLQGADLVRQWGSLPATGLGMLVGGACFFPFFGLPFPAGLDARAWLLIALIVLVGTVGAYTLFLYGASRIGSMEATLLGCLEPVTATLLSALWLGSAFPPGALVGFACILGSVLLLTAAKQRGKK